MLYIYDVMNFVLITISSKNNNKIMFFFFLSTMSLLKVTMVSVCTDENECHDNGKFSINYEKGFRLLIINHICNIL